MRKILSVLVCVCIMLSCVSFSALAQTGTDRKFTFSDFTEPLGSFGSETNAKTSFANIPNASNENYGKLYYWEPATGMFGKDASDTSLYFKSEYDKASLPTETGAQYIENPLVNFSGGVNGITKDEYYHIGFEFARDGGNFGGYIMLRPNTNTGNCKRMQNIGFSKRNESSDNVNIFGVGATIEHKKWYKFDLVFKPQVDASEAQDGSDIRTQLSVYLDGRKVVDSMYIDCDSSEAGYQYITGMDHIRFALDPRSQDGVYPKTETYIDNVVSEVLEKEPQIFKASLSHSDETLNSYIDNDARTIYYYGQTIQEMKDGLSEENGAEIKFTDLSGNEISDLSKEMRNCYVSVSYNGQNEYYSTENKMHALTSSEYEINYNTNTVPAYLYTPVSDYKEKFEVADGYSLKITDENENEAVSGDIKNGYSIKVLDQSGNAEEVYKINFYGKALYEDFESFSETKFYYGGKNNTQNGWQWTSAAFNEEKMAADGVTAADAAYYLPMHMTGRGKVLQVHSKGKYNDAYSHITLARSGSLPNAESYGDKFVIEYSVMLPTDDDSVRWQTDVVKKDGSTVTYLNPIILSGKNITVWGQKIGTYKAGEWQDVMVYNDAKTGDFIVFLNGNKAFEGNSDTVKDFLKFTSTRLLQHFCQDNDIEYNAYIDKLAFYGVGGLTESFYNNINVSLKSSVYTVEGDYINGYYNMTAQDMIDASEIADGAEIEIYNEDGTKAERSAKAKKNMYVTVTSADKSNSKIYTLNIEHHSMSDIDYLVNGMHLDGKFAKGNVKASVKVDAYLPTSVSVIIAQYKDGKMINHALTENKSVTGKNQKVEAEIEIENAKDTKLKIMVWEDTENAMPISNFVELEAFEGGKIISFSKTYPNYTQKAITFSYDDGYAGDADLIKIFNKYNLKGTFNLISNWVSQGQTQTVADRYYGHEIATHSNTHPRMYVNDSSEIDGGYTPLTLEQCVEEFRIAQERLKEISGSYPVGGAWPYTAPTSRAFYNELLDKMQNELGIMYMRPTATKNDFNLPTNWMDWRANCHHDRMEGFIDRYLELDTNNELKVFYVWGHTFEFPDTYKPEETKRVRWDDMDKMCSRFADRSVTWAATNAQIYNYAKAMEKVVVDYNENSVSNNSDMDLYFIINGEKVMIPKNTVANF